MSHPRFVSSKLATSDSYKMSIFLSSQDVFDQRLLEATQEELTSSGRNQKRHQDYLLYKNMIQEALKNGNYSSLFNTAQAMGANLVTMHKIAMAMIRHQPTHSKIAWYKDVLFESTALLMECEAIFRANLPINQEQEQLVSKFFGWVEEWVKEHVLLQTGTNRNEEIVINEYFSLLYRCINIVLVRREELMILAVQSDQEIFSARLEESKEDLYLFESARTSLNNNSKNINTHFEWILREIQAQKGDLLHAAYLSRFISQHENSLLFLQKKEKKEEPNKSIHEIKIDPTPSLTKLLTDLECTLSPLSDTDLAVIKADKSEIVARLSRVAQIEVKHQESGKASTKNYDLAKQNVSNYLDKNVMASRLRYDVADLVACHSLAIGMIRDYPSNKNIIYFHQMLFETTAFLIEVLVKSPEDYAEYFHDFLQIHLILQTGRENQPVLNKYFSLFYKHLMLLVDQVRQVFPGNYLSFLSGESKDSVQTCQLYKDMEKSAGKNVVGLLDVLTMLQARVVSIQRNLLDIAGLFRFIANQGELLGCFELQKKSNEEKKEEEKKIESNNDSNQPSIDSSNKEKNEDPVNKEIKLQGDQEMIDDLKTNDRLKRKSIEMDETKNDKKEEGLTQDSMVDDLWKAAKSGPAIFSKKCSKLFSGTIQIVRLTSSTSNLFKALQAATQETLQVCRTTHKDTLQVLFYDMKNKQEKKSARPVPPPVSHSKKIKNERKDEKKDEKEEKKETKPLSQPSGRVVAEIPADGSCAYTSWIMAVFLTLRSSQADFDKMFVRLFGADNDGTLQKFQESIKNYNGKLSFFNNQTRFLFTLLINRLRNTVANYINEHQHEQPFPNLLAAEERGIEDFLRRLRQNGEWAGTFEIAALAYLSGINVIISNEGDNEMVYRSDVTSSNRTITLQHTTSDSHTPDARNHYVPLLDPIHITPPRPESPTSSSLSALSMFSNTVSNLLLSNSSTSQENARKSYNLLIKGLESDMNHFHRGNVDEMVLGTVEGTGIELLQPAILVAAESAYKNPGRLFVLEHLIREGADVTDGMRHHFLNSSEPSRQIYQPIFNLIDTTKKHMQQQRAGLG